MGGGNCTDNSDCHRGICAQNICDCVLYVTGTHCEITFEQDVGVGFLVWRFGFMIIFFALSVLISTQIYNSWVQGSIKKLRGVCVCLILGNSFLRFLYFATDPLNQTGDIPKYLESIIYSFGFYFWLIAYLMVVLFWVDLYHGRVNSGKVLVKRTKYSFIVIIIILFVLEFSQATIFGLQIPAVLQDPVFAVVYNTCLTIATLGLSGGMLIYGTLVYYQKKNIAKLFPGMNNQIVKLTSTIVMVSATLFVSAIITVIVTALNVFSYPTATIVTFTVYYSLEIMLDVQMLYLVTPKSSPSTTEPHHHNLESGSNGMRANVSVRITETTENQEDENDT